MHKADKEQEMGESKKRSVVCVNVFNSKVYSDDEKNAK